VPVLALLLTVLLALADAQGATAATAHEFAHAAREIGGKATAHLRLVKAEGSRLFEQGPVAGALVGSMRSELTVGAVFTGTFTIYTRSGSITGRGRASPHGSGRYQSFNGSFVAIRGTGRYAHVNGHAGLYGVFDRRTYSVVIQTTGQLSY
jgi:hypothetical protein